MGGGYLCDIFIWVLVRELVWHHFSAMTLHWNLTSILWSELLFSLKAATTRSHKAMTGRCRQPRTHPWGASLNSFRTVGAGTGTLEDKMFQEVCDGLKTTGSAWRRNQHKQEELQSGVPPHQQQQAEEVRGSWQRVWTAWWKPFAEEAGDFAGLGKKLQTELLRIGVLAYLFPVKQSTLQNRGSLAFWLSQLIAELCFVLSVPRWGIWAKQAPLFASQEVQALRHQLEEVISEAPPALQTIKTEWTSLAGVWSRRGEHRKVSSLSILGPGRLCFSFQLLHVAKVRFLGLPCVQEVKWSNPLPWTGHWSAVSSCRIEWDFTLSIKVKAS